MSTTAFITNLGSDLEFNVYAKKDSVTGGIFGILLPEGVVGAFSFEGLLKVYRKNSFRSEGNTDTKHAPLDILMQENIIKRLSVHIAAQMLSLLDAFIFPEDSSLDLKSSQLQGLALVRGTEKQIGNAQGPL
eukprot:CAMPEP_0201185348 /NCGR_PEP_ID=MMETSP0851-20130426/128650_1 /ASSEMBLY_ACC=CAM_ASM_000631 /TAXON_ID=183588 /ORGANISM="Pseudo-nitzschia fraudulenta, Strain WWA7" /LENGTH=131 /DNA_ID=CAMNT_0047470475 /DNA_START=51 /DNA_END=443 /DNA_ORIENTATION=+